MSEEIMATDSLLTINAELRRALDVAMAESDSWRALAEQLNQRSSEAFALLGQMDYFLQTYSSQPDRIQRQQAAKLHAELKQLVGLK